MDGGMVGVFNNAHTAGHVLCCLCGVQIHANPSNMCINCIKTQVDITEGIQKQVTVLWCKECERYHQPPRAWIKAELESKELLQYCIKRVKGLSKVKLVDAGFIWTEPHSKRLKVKLTIQKEIHNGAILQQAFPIEYVVENHMCEACARVAANPDQWVAVAQVRQNVEHKRTFFFLEQLILKHGADADVTGIKDVGKGGLDFFFNHRSHSLKFVHFLSQVVPIKKTDDKQLVSHDSKNNTYNYRHTFAVEIVPVCKDDLICLPVKVANKLGNLGPIVVCTRVNNNLTFVDPNTMRVGYQDADKFYQQPFGALLHSKQLVEYMVLDVELLGPEAQGGKVALADCQVARVSDFGRNDVIFHCRTHLGTLLSPGDRALGYDLTRANLVDPELEKYKGLSLPEVVLVRKSYVEGRRKKAGKGEGRNWKLKEFAHVETDMVTSNKTEIARQEADRARFMEELEEDEEMRSRINLYRDPDARPARRGGEAEEEMGDDDDDEVPEVPLDELLDALQIADHGPNAAGQWPGEDGGSGDDMED